MTCPAPAPRLQRVTLSRGQHLRPGKAGSAVFWVRSSLSSDAVFKI